MYKNILIPVTLDGSRDTDMALKAARTLGDADARYTLLYVIDMIPTYIVDQLPQHVFETNRKDALVALQEMAKDLPGAHAVLADGKAGPRILRWAKENSNDCIVIASHEPAMADFLLGSTAHQVVRHAHCAVHVLR